MRKLLLLIFVSSCFAQVVFTGPGTTTGAHTRVAPTTIVLGSQATGATTATNFQTPFSVPILMWNAPGGYTLANLHVQVSTSSGNIVVGIYNSTTSGCPTGASICAGTKLCNNTATATSLGDNSFTLSGCGTFAANQYYFLSVINSSSSLVYTSQSGLFCSGTGFYRMNGPSQGSVLLPATMGTQTEATSDCPEFWATFNCVSSCGSANIPWTTFAYTGNTSGATVTAANLLTGSTCLNGSITTGTQLTSTTYINTPVQAFNNPVISCGSSVTGGSLSVKRTTTTTDAWSYAFTITPGGTTQANLAFWFQNTSNTMTAGDTCDIGEIDAGNTTTWNMLDNAGTVGLRIERSGGTTLTTSIIPISQSTFYFLNVLNINGGIHLASIYSTTGTQVGSTIFVPSDHAGNPTGIRMLNDGSCSATAGNFFYGPIKFDPSGQTYPITGELFPDSPQVIGKEYSAMVDEGLIPHAELRSSGWWSYALGRYLGAAQ